VRHHETARTCRRVVVVIAVSWTCCACLLLLQKYEQAAKVWVRAGERKYLLRLSVYGRAHSKQVLIGRGCVVLSAL
jgi:hypothetical protein